jgi:uncharacterized membrane protein (DUF373 family)
VNLKNTFAEDVNGLVLYEIRKQIWAKLKHSQRNSNLTIIDVDITMVVRELLRRLASNLWQTSHVSPE